ncbi:hypothetical protein ACVWZD_006018 [Streptomyces sp. TE3672]
MVPLVKCSRAMSLGEVGGIVKVSAASAISAARETVPGSSSAPSPTMSTWRRAASPPRRPATFLRYSSAVVTSTFASLSVTRCATGSGPNAENNGHSTLVFFSVPRTTV